MLSCLVHKDLWVNELVSEASKSSIVWCSHDVRVVIRLKLYVCSEFLFFFSLSFSSSPSVLVPAVNREKSQHFAGKNRSTHGTAHNSSENAFFELLREMRSSGSSWWCWSSLLVGVATDSKNICFHCVFVWYDSAAFFLLFFAQHTYSSHTARSSPTLVHTHVVRLVALFLSRTVTPPSTTDVKAKKNERKSRRGGGKHIENLTNRLLLFFFFARSFSRLLQDVRCRRRVVEHKYM